MDAASICGSAVDFDDRALVILSTILFGTKSPFTSTIFWFGLFKVVLSAWVSEILWCQ